MKSEFSRIQNIGDFRACQKVFAVLRDAGGNPAPFSEPFPNLHAPTRQLAFQQKVELIHIVAGGLARRPVDGDAVPHLILNDQHPQLL